MKKFIMLFLAVAMLVSFSGCGKMKTLHCDSCNTEVKVAESSNMNEEWVIYCEECNEKLFKDDPLLKTK